jgi:hypothetical protein
LLNLSFTLRSALIASPDPEASELPCRLQISRAGRTFTRIRLVGLGFLLLVLSWMAVHPSTYEEPYPPGTLMWMGKIVIA